MSIAKLFGIGTLVLGARIIGALLQFALTLTLVRLYPIQTVGLIAILLSISILCRVGGPLGLDLYALRELSLVWQRDRSAFKNEVARLNSSLAVAILPLSLVVVGVLAIFPQFRSVPALLYCVPFVVVASAFHRLWAAEMRSRDRVVGSQVVDAMTIPCFNLAAAGLAADSSPHTVLFAITGSLVLAALVMRAALGLNLALAKPVSFSEWMKIVPLGFGSMVSALASRIPVLFLGVVSLPQAAIYDVGQRFHSAATLASISASSVFLPRVRGHMKHGTQGVFWREFFSMSIMGAIPALSLFVILLVLQESGLTRILGSEYGDAWTVAVLLTCSAVVTATLGLFHGVLAMLGKTVAYTILPILHFGLVTICATTLGKSASTMALLVLIAEATRGVVLFTLGTRAIRTSIPRNEAGEIRVKD